MGGGNGVAGVCACEETKVLRVQQNILAHFPSHSCAGSTPLTVKPSKHARIVKTMVHSMVVALPWTEIAFVVPANLQRTTLFTVSAAPGHDIPACTLTSHFHEVLCHKQRLVQHELSVVNTTPQRQSATPYSRGGVCSKARFS